MTTFICAEIGVNFRNLNEADEMIREAAAAGAAAVKFQAYDVALMDRDTDPVLVSQLNMIQLNETAVRYLYWRCRAAGVELMVTPMYPGAVPMLDPYVKRWKIRYKDRENEAILSPCRATGKPMLISGENVFCVPEYPPSIDYTAKSLSLFHIGYSNHIPCFSVWTEENVSAFKSLDYLEVHVKRDHYPDNYCPIDNAVSITMSELAELCRRLK